MKLARKTSVGEAIIGDLQDLLRDVKNGRGLESKYGRRDYRLALDPPAFDAKRVRETRLLLGVSQLLFARLLGVSVHAVRSWERASSHPSRIARRFMAEFQHDPAYWQGRIKSSILPGE